MKYHFVHDNEGRVCSKFVSFDYIDGKIHNVYFEKGCMGNAQGISRLAEGREPEELIRLLKGIECRGISSCPNEFALGLEEMLEEMEQR